MLGPVCGSVEHLSALRYKGGLWALSTARTTDRLEGRKGRFSLFFPHGADPTWSHTKSRCSARAQRLGGVGVTSGLGVSHRSGPSELELSEAAIWELSLPKGMAHALQKVKCVPYVRAFIWVLKLLCSTISKNDL